MNALRIAVVSLGSLLALAGCDRAPRAVTVTVEPSEVDVVPLGTVQFTAKVEGSYGTRVRWEVRTNGPDVGSIDPVTGLYTAPARIPRDNLIVVAAFSEADPDERDRGRITVVPPPISPSRGPTAGGTRVTITGAFDEAAPPAVFFGDRAGIDVVVDSEVRLRVTVPPSANGIEPVDVRIEDGERSALHPRAFHYAATDLVFGGSRFVEDCEQRAFDGSAIDLENDGDADLALLCSGDDGPTVVLLRNDGGRTIPAGTIAGVSAMVQPVHSIVAADLDGDLVDDLVLAGTTAAQSFLNDGTGSTFTAITPVFSYPGNDSGRVFQVLAADMNGDARADLVLAGDDLTGGMSPQRIAFARAVIGDGGGGFTVPFGRGATSSTPEKLFVSIGLFDLQGDGDSDVLLVWDGRTTQDGGVVPILNPGNGALPDNATNNSVGQHVDSGAIGDIGGDGLADAVVEANATVFRFEAQANGTLMAETTLAGALAQGNRLAMFDLDADGEDDLVSWDATRTDEAFTIPFLGVSWGPLDDGAIETTTLDVSVVPAAVFALGTGGALQMALLGGRVETIAADPGRSSGGERTAALATRARRVEARAVAGAPSLLAALDAAGAGAVAALDASLGTTSLVAVPGSVGASLRVTSADLDGNARPDALAMDGEASGVWLLSGGAGGTLSAPVLHPFPGPVVDALMADVTSDGVPDLVALGDGTAWFAPASGGALGAAQVAPIGGIGAGIRIRASDLDEDGAVELLVATAGTAGRLSVHEVAGNGIFADAVLLDVGTSPVDVLVADVNEDYLLDVVVQGIVDQVPELCEISVYLGQGELGFAPPRRHLVILSPIDTLGLFTDFDGFGLAFGDLDGDGLGDLVLPVETPRGAVVLRNLGAGDFGNPEPVPIGGLTVGVSVADLDGDGIPDLAAADLTGGAIRRLRNGSR